MEQILEFITRYGLPVFIIASCIIFLIGILKLCKVFKKITNANIRKTIYYVLDIILAFGGSAIYFAIFKCDFAGYVMFSIAQVSATTTLYAVYENFHFRDCVQWLLNLIAKHIKTNPNSKLSKLLKDKFGFNDEELAKIQENVNNILKTKEEKNTEEVNKV